MKKEEIIPWDWHRILIGMESFAYLSEVLFRAVVVYLMLLVIVRLLGKRLDGQITLAELAVIILFGALIAPSMQMHERGILIGGVALVCVFTLERLVNLLSIKQKI